MNTSHQSDWKACHYEGLCPSQMDWARMAAFIDGEGSILINPRRGRNAKSPLSMTFYLRLTVANTDARLPMWIKSTFGGSIADANTKKYYEGKNYKVCWHWNTSAYRAAWILYNCLPYFVMKREQAEIGIDLQTSMSKFVRGIGKELPFDVVEERRELKRRLLELKARGNTREPSQQARIDEVIVK